MKTVRQKELYGEPVRDEIEYGLGAVYPMPGGLKEDVKWFLGDSAFVRQIEGERHMYEYLKQRVQHIVNRDIPFLLIDALNCANGCLCGTAMEPAFSNDKALYTLMKIQKKIKEDNISTDVSKDLTPEQRLKELNQRFAHLDINDYLRSYRDLSALGAVHIPDAESLEQIYRSMRKNTPASRQINCMSCGYYTCYDMATAIYNGFNHRENCVYYLKTTVEKSQHDDLLGIFNRRYRQAAELVIDDIMKYDVSHDDNILRLGDWAYDVEFNDKYYTATRASDFIMQYFPVFYIVTGDERWMQFYDNTYGIINYFVEKYQTGLLPDFIIKDSSGEWIPAPANFLENENDGVYEYNSCRVPWRISTDALVGKNADAKKYAETVNAFFVNETGGKPEKIMAGYTPDGKAVADWDDLCFTAPLMLSAAAAGDTKWHDTVRKEVLDIGVDSYFGNTIAMLCLITDDGGWLVPETTAAKPTGDVNDDGEFNISDIVLFQKWLLAVPDTHLANWKAADYCNDNVSDSFDLCLMRKALIIRTAGAYDYSDRAGSVMNISQQ